MLKTHGCKYVLLHIQQAKFIAIETLLRFPLWIFLNRSNWELVMKTILFFISLLIIGPSIHAGSNTVMPGLQEPVTVLRDSNGIPHIKAENEHDVFFMQGWVHAQDRLFQMDTSRRQIAGTLSELFGPDTLELDVQFRTLGLGLASQRSLAAHPQSFRDLLQAYSDGVNAYIEQAEAVQNLPPEYAALQLSSVKRWTPLDSVMVGKGLGALTSFDPNADIDLSIVLGSYQFVGSLAGFDGTKLFFEDLYRTAPFHVSATVPDAEKPLPWGKGKNKNRQRKGNRSAEIDSDSKHFARSPVSRKSLDQARSYRDQMRKLPRVPGVHQPESDAGGGSNTWVISGKYTNNGRALLANDMHLTLNSPTIFHQLHLVTPDLDVIGSSIAGAPCVVRGHNEHLAWGITNARLDVTDVYTETIVPDSASPSGISTVYQGNLEPIIPRLEDFYANISGQIVPVLENQPVLTIPRRNNGPMITEPEANPDTGGLTALSVQSTGFSATRDPEGICGFNRARNLDEFKTALQLIDFASQNISYADTKGNIAYFVSGEVPLREDLQNAEPGDIVAPPFMIRNGSGGHEWIPEAQSLPDQAVPYRIMPFAEMPQTVNPASGIIINANNDQIGNSLDNNSLNDARPDGGLYYLNWGGSYFSIRSGRIKQLLEARLKHRAGIKPRDMKKIQADVVMLDAQVFVPAILRAYKRAMRKDAHPLLASMGSNQRVAEVISRFSKWDYSAPTGLAEGYDAFLSDDDHLDDVRSVSDLNNSIATTIYSVWRHEMVANTIDVTLASVGLSPLTNVREERVTALRHLLDNFDSNQGIGASGLNFFAGPADADATTRRDIKVLQSLADALDKLASVEFEAAFNLSSNQEDYQWGKLHRIVFEHPLGGTADVFNVPPAFGFFSAPLDGLAGIPVDGGFETIDVGNPTSHIVTPGTDSFMFSAGATGRFVSQFKRNRVKAQSSLPGGESAIPGSPFYLNLLEPWLRNETHRLTVSLEEVEGEAWSIEQFSPVTE